MNKSLEYGQGYSELGLYDEARAEFSSVPRSDPDFPEAWNGLGWLANRCQIREQDKIAEEGLALIEAGYSTSIVVAQTALCLHFAGRTREAYDLTRSTVKWFEWNAEDHYGMATYACGVGQWAEAAWHLIECLRKGGDPHIFFDLDLESLFQHVAKNGPDRLTALALAHPAFKRALSQYAGQNKEIDGMLERQLPSSLRPHLVREPQSKFLVLPPSATAEGKVLFQTWRASIGTRIEGFAAQAIERSREFVLNSQLDWAAQAARRGDFFAARYHIVFSLAQRPDWMEPYAEVAGPLGMKYLFDDIRGPMEADSRFCRRIQLLTPVHQKPADWVEKVMAEFSPRAKKSALWKIISAAQASRAGDDRRHLQFLLEVILKWPTDPTAYGNLVNFCAKRGQWHSAKGILARTPPSLLHLRVARTITLRVMTRSSQAHGDAIYKVPFYGQPDIGEMVRQPSPMVEATAIPRQEHRSLPPMSGK